MEFQNPESQNTNSQGNNSKLFLPLGLLLIIVAVVSGYFFLIKKPSQNGAISTPSIPLDERSPEEQLGSLKLSGVVDVPSIKNATPVQASAVPKDLLEVLGFFGTGIKDLKVESVNFDNGQTGFVANFSVSKTNRGAIEAVLGGVTTHPSWVKLYTVFSKKAILAEIANKNYIASIEGTLPTDLAVLTHIIFIKK